MSWDENKIQILKKEWGKGKTASQIAELIGGVSRNAVIGKAHRLNLSIKVRPKNTSYNTNSRNENLINNSVQTPRKSKFKASPFSSLLALRA